MHPWRSGRGVLLWVAGNVGVPTVGLLQPPWFVAGAEDWHHSEHAGTALLEARTGTQCPSCVPGREPDAGDGMNSWNTQ